MPEGLTTSIGRPGAVNADLLNPHGYRPMVIDRSRSSQFATPDGPIDVVGFRIGDHRFWWRVTPAGSGGTAGEVDRVVQFMVDGAPIGHLVPNQLESPRMHEARANPEVWLCGSQATCAIVPAVRRRATTRCYQVQWRDHRWQMAMVRFPHTFGLWKGDPSTGEPGDDDQERGRGRATIISGHPCAGYSTPRIKRPARLTWSADASLLDVIICATRGQHGDFTQLASTKAQVAYSLAADFSL